jgi:hypothetical protein
LPRQKDVPDYRHTFCMGLRTHRSGGGRLRPTFDRSLC